MAITETRIAPHSVEAEESVLGSILINPDALLVVIDLLAPGDFFILRHTWVYEAMLRLRDRREAIDYLTVTKELEAHAKLEEIGGRAYLTYLVNSVPTSIHAETYARQVKRFSTRRQLLEATGLIAELAYQDQAEDQEVFDGAETALFNVTGRAALREAMPVNVAWSVYYDAFSQEENGDSVLPLGLADLDALLGGGLERSELALIAGRPGMGKSGFLFTVALDCAQRGLRVGVYSMEMTIKQMMRRFIGMVAHIDTRKLRARTLDDDEYQRFVNSADVFDALGDRLFLDYQDEQSVYELRRKVRRQATRTGLDVVLVDYLQLLSAPADQFERQKTSEEELGEIARALDALAGELNVPVLSVVQLNRAVEQRADKRPMLSDLRGSGRIEQIAKVVMFVYRDGMYHPDTGTPNVAEIIVAKHRDGSTGVAETFYRQECTQFANLRRVNLDDLGRHHAARETAA